MSAPGDEGGRARGADRAVVVISQVLLAIAAVLVFDALRIQANVVYGLGPQAMPIVVAIGLVVLAEANLANAVRGADAEPEQMDFRPVLLILGGLLAMIAIIDRGGGFIAAMTVLFAATATAFGRRAIVNDLIIGAVLATVIYLAFNKLLTLSLPAGPLERLF